jgi:hypothetical protein
LTEGRSAIVSLAVPYPLISSWKGLTITFDKAHYHQYFQDRVSELTSINHSIWGFVGAAALLEYVTQLLHSGDSSPQKYKDFFASKYINPKYNAFIYQNGKQDLPVQIYHTYRCGLLHGFSLTPDSKGIARGARAKSIVFNSLKDTPELVASENCKAYKEYGFDACRLILEPFVQDIGVAIDKIFADATIEQSIIDSASKHPPFNYYG